MSSTTSFASKVKPTAASNSKASAAGPSVKPASTNAGSPQFKELTRTMEFKWFLAHALVVINSVLTLVFFRAPVISSVTYRLAFLSGFASFAVILYQKYNKSRPTLQVLLRDDNFQYAAATLFWVFTSRFMFALLPVSIYSFFHALTYLRSYLLPALGHSSNSALVKRIDVIVKNYNEPLTVLASNFELVLLIQLLGNALAFVRGSWIQLIFYFTFFRVRYSTSAYTRHAVKAWEVRVDQLAGHPSLPPSIKSYWVRLKSYIASIPGPTNKT